MPETANVSLEEIDAIFDSSAAQEDLQRKFEVCHVYVRITYYDVLTIDVSSNMSLEYMT